MGINQVQFQKGLSIAQFMERYGTEEQCHAELVAMRWPDGFVCQACDTSKHSTFMHKGLRYWQCGGCREQTTAICQRSPHTGQPRIGIYRPPEPVGGVGRDRRLPATL